MSYVKQVGGEHYSGTEYQHWDMVVDTDMNYLQACATKYLLREKENRYQDLDKALSFVKKANKCGIRALHPDDFISLNFWLEGVDIPAEVEAAIVYVADADYYEASILINKLMDDECQKEMKGYVNQG